MEHPNITETHLLPNTKGEVYLVEERLPEVLSDATSLQLEEASNLLYDIAKALVYLHKTLGLVHGDIKPDNIGKRGGDYVLLDFGICRPADQFTSEVTPTGL